MKASKRKFRTLLFLFYQIATEIFIRRRRRAFFIFSKERKAGAYVEKLNKVVVRLYQDVVFRCVFGREGMEVYLIGLLNAIFLQFGFLPIKKLTIKNPYQFPRTKNRKLLFWTSTLRTRTGDESTSKCKRIIRSLLTNALFTTRRKITSPNLAGVKSTGDSAPLSSSLLYGSLFPTVPTTVGSTFNKCIRANIRTYGTTT